MYEPMTANTLAEAAEWLVDATGEKWTSKRVLDSAIAASGDVRRACLSVVPPRATSFGFYDCSLSGRLPPQFLRLDLNCRFPLAMDCAVDIFNHGEGRASIITAPGEARANYVCIEPEGSYVRITAEMLRIGRVELLELAEGPQIRSKIAPSPLLTVEAQRERSGTADNEATWWSLRLLASENDWPQRESRPFITKCLAALDQWDGSILRRLKAGPPSGNIEHIPVKMGNILKTRERILDPEIGQAMTLAADSSSVQSVFAELVKLANLQFGCLLEAVERDQISERRRDIVLQYQELARQNAAR